LFQPSGKSDTLQHNAALSRKINQGALSERVALHEQISCKSASLDCEATASQSVWLLYHTAEGLRPRADIFQNQPPK
jgi:hypothetical protein